jgi:hypothetical protein
MIKVQTANGEAVAKHACRIKFDASNKLVKTNLREMQRTCPWRRIDTLLGSH